MRFLHNKKFLTGTILAIAVVLFLVLNVSSGFLFKSLRLDLTANKLYTLSDGSKQIIRDLEEPIRLRLYFSKSLANINPYLLSFASRVEDLLKQYQNASRGKVVVEVIDPEPFSSAEDAAVNYGLQGAPVDNAGTELYFGLVGTNSLNDKQIIPFLQPNRETSLEYDISQLIYKLSHPEPRIVGVMSSLPIEGDISSRPWSIWQQMSQLFDLQVIDYNTEEISKDIKTLMIIEPSTFSDKALKAIDDFVMRGGHVLAFVDPATEVADAKTAYLNKSRQKDAGDYLTLLKSWGVDFAEDKVVTDRALAKSVRVPYEGREVAVRYPLWMDFTVDNFAKDDILSSSLELLTLATPGALAKSADATSEFTPLVTTTDQAMLVDANNIQDYQHDFASFIKNYKPSGSSYVTAARISGPIKSAYSDASVKDASIIVIADCDMLHDHFWLNVQSVMGQDFAVPTSSNANLVLSALDNLSGSNALISIRNRSSFARPFETIRAIEMKSQDKYLESEQLLQQKLQLAKQKLEQMENQKKDGNSILLSVQQKQEQEDFRKELVDTRKELRDVRRKLNQDIESVALGVKFFSIGFVPLLIVFFGLGAWGLQIQRELKNRRAACSIQKH